MEQRIGILTLGVADLDRSWNFRQASVGPVVVFFQTGSLALAQHLRAGLAKDAHIAAEG